MPRFEYSCAFHPPLPGRIRHGSHLSGMSIISDGIARIKGFSANGRKWGPNGHQAAGKLLAYSLLMPICYLWPGSAEPWPA